MSGGINQAQNVVSNRDFLKAVFGADWQKAHVTGFVEDPGSLDALGLRWKWGGAPCGGTPPEAWDENNYFTISVFSGGRRRKADFERCHCLVVDDVGTGSSAKVDPSLLASWPRPSWRLETSPGNEQWGYILAGGGDARGGKVAALLDEWVAMGLTVDGSDPGMKGVTRYAKLPVGSNRKARWGPGGFRNVLREWRPARVYRLDDLARTTLSGEALGRWQSAGDDLGGGAPAGVVVQRGSDWLLDLMLDEGVATGAQHSPGVWELNCPYLGEHTQRVNSGTVYLTGEGFGWFRCEHGHCQGRSQDDFVAGVRSVVGEQKFDAARAAALDREFGDIGGSEDPFREERKGAAEQRAEARRESFRGRFAGAFRASDAKVDPQGAAWLLKGVLPRNGLGAVYGAPKDGKSFVLLDLLCHLSGGLDWRGHRIKRRGLHVLVSAEGGRYSAQNRVAAWMGENPGLVPGSLWVYPGSVVLGGDPAALEELLVWLEDLSQSEGLETCSVWFDTLNQNMSGDENSAQDVGVIVQSLKRVVSERDCFAGVVHHTGKDRERGLRGSTALLGALDVSIEVWRNKETDEGAITVVDGRDVVERSWGFELIEVDLGLDVDGDPITSRAVKPLGRVPERKAPAASPGVKMGPIEKKVLAIWMDLTQGTGDPKAGNLSGNWTEDLLDEALVRLKSEHRTDNIRRAVEKLDEKGAIPRPESGPHFPREET